MSRSLLLCCGCALNAGPIVAPLEYDQGLYFIDVYVGECAEPRQFILDTGAEVSVIDRRIARDFDCVSDPSVRLRSVKGALAGVRTEPLRLRIAEDASLKRSFWVMDLRRASSRLGRRIDGLIGLDFFADRRVIVDFAAMQLVFDPIIEPGSVSLEALRICEQSAGLCVDLEINGSTLRSVRIDTGYNGSLIWSPTNVMDAHCPGRFIRGRAALTLAGTVTEFTGAQRIAQPLFRGEGGLLGTEVLSQFRALWIDRRRQTVRFVGLEE